MLTERDAVMGPEVPARLAAVHDTPVRGELRALPDGHWTVGSPDGTQLVLDSRLRVVARFAIPGDCDQDYRVHVNPDHSLAVFADPQMMVLVDAKGQTRWRTSYSPFLSCDGDPVPAAAAFTPDGSALWAFVPDGPQDQWSQAKRLTVDPLTGTVTGATSTGFKGGSDITIHPDGQHTGYADFDGHEYFGRWVSCCDSEETVMAKGDWREPDVSPDGSRWVANGGFMVTVGRFTDGVVSHGIDWAETVDERPFSGRATFINDTRVVVDACYEGDDGDFEARAADRR